MCRSIRVNCGLSLIHREGPLSMKRSPAVHFAIVLLGLGLLSLATKASAESPAVVADEVDFSRDIQPILAERCLLCHGPDDAESGLRLDSAAAAQAAADSSAVAIVPGDPDGSELIRRIVTDDESLRMPPDGDPLTAEEVERFRVWIAAGGRFDRHWAFRPITTPPAVPSVDEIGEAAVAPLDRFVLSRLEQAGLEPSPVAERGTLIRRLHFDLLGLPPSLEQTAAFVGSTAPDAYERLVDSLLASDHFGERWGRHWLDMARYADSDGYEKDRPRPHAWRYRDWVIEAINRDLPLDRFAIEQLAGDLLPESTPLQQLATAFNRQTLTNTEGGVDQEEFRVEATFDRAETTAAVWMGLTMNCARCHSHKYDPISHRDYFRLFALFNAVDEAEIEVPVSSPLPASDRADSDASAMLPAAVIAAAVRDTRRLERGDFLQPAEEVLGGGLEVLEAVHPLRSRYEGSPPDRLDLAHWLFDPNHPLTSRVIVNQVWARLFGRGLVATVNDFGVRGERPSHPELLDWLAWRLSHDWNWSRKALIREIVTSATYRQASHQRPQPNELDPTNRLLSRQNRVRVEAEIVRDLALASSGLLERRVGGPSVFPPLPPGIAELSYANNFKWKTSAGGDRYRRGMYTFFKRTAPHPTLITFDCPDANTSRLRRDSSNTPLQALTLLNDEVFNEAAIALALRVLDSTHDDDRERLRYAFRLCLTRPPAESELESFAELLAAADRYYRADEDAAERLLGAITSTDYPPQRIAAWAATTRILINLDEFIVRD